MRAEAREHLRSHAATKIGRGLTGGRNEGGLKGTTREYG